jgi:hypothetical protein
MIDSELIRTAFADLSTQAIGFLPILATALVILLLGWMIARVLASVTRRVADHLGIERYAERSGLSGGLIQAKIERTLTDLLGTLVFWLIFLSATLIALDHLGLTNALVPLQSLIAFLPRVLAAILVIIVGSVLAQWIGQAAQAAVASLGVEFHRQIGRAVRIILLAAVGIIALQQLGLELDLFTGAFINLITIAAAGFALAFAFGGREIVRNILAGYYAKEIFATGDKLIVDKQEGTLEAIGTINAEISIGEDVLVIPNSQLINKKVRVIHEPKSP